MISNEAREEIARMFAERKGPGRPLSERRRQWEADELAKPLPANAVVEQVVAGGIASEWVRMGQVHERHVFLLLHGGGYNAGSPRTHRRMAANLSEVTHLPVLIPDYRLAPEHAFPAAVKDALLAYGWLLSQGREPGDIVVGGDSAGGGLALSMLLALREAGAPMPRAGVLLAPWTDLTCSSASYERLADKDPIISQEGLAEAGRWYAGRRDPHDPMASPLFADASMLKGLPPLIIHAGGDEVMVDDSRLFAERVEEAGVETHYKMWPGLWHVFHHACPQVPEARQAMGEIGAFVRRQFGHEV